ncbi:hypothetical protein D3C76_1238070 [compost metagenome]
MADADGENQEGYQDRVGVQAVAQQAEDTQLAHHGQQTGEDGDRGAAPAATIGIEQGADQHHGDDEEQSNVRRCRQQIANDLRKANHPNGHALGRETFANLLVQGLAEGAIVQGLAGLWIIIQ